MDYSNILYGVLGHLGKAIIVIGAFYFGHHMAKAYKKQLQNYIAVLAFVAVISFGMGQSLGTHTEDADPIYGGGNEIIDYETTPTERNEYSWTMFFVLSIPALYGLYKGSKEKN